MSLSKALFSTINNLWEAQSEDEEAYLSTVHIHKSLADAIKNNGEEVPDCFDPNSFNFIVDGNYFEIPILVSEQDELITYEYE